MHRAPDLAWQTERVAGARTPALAAPDQRGRARSYGSAGPRSRRQGGAARRSKLAAGSAAPQPPPPPRLEACGELRLRCPEERRVQLGGGASAPRFSGHDAAGGAAGAPAAGAQSRGDEKAYIRGPCAALAQAPQSTIVAPSTPRQPKSRHNRHAAGGVIRAWSRDVNKCRII